MVTLFVKGQLNHMVKILVEFLFAAAAKTVEAFAGGGHRRAVEQHAAVHGCMVVRGGNVHSAVDLQYS